MRSFLLTLSLALSGCWNFEALSGGGERQGDGPARDLSGADLICLGTALVENCSNGVDDDGDCAADCDDNECAGKEICRPVDGLLGYGEFTRGAGVCGTGSTLAGPANLYDKIDMGQKGCSGCACDAPAASCTSELRLYSKAGCKNNDLIPTNGKIALPGAMSCNVLDNAVRMASSAVFDAPSLKCNVNSAGAQPNPAIMGQGRLCLKDTAQKSCTTPACVLSQLPGVRACIAQSGNDCPSGFAKKETWYQSYKDPRTCQCTCGSPGGACEAGAAGTGTLYANGTCNDASKNALTPGECKDLMGAFMSQSFDFNYKPKAGATCTPSGTAMGAATLEGAVTLCCTQ